MFAHAFIDIDPDGKTIIRANTETHSGHTLVPAVVSLRTVIRLADQLGLIILDPELIQEGDRGKDHRPRLHRHLTRKLGPRWARGSEPWPLRWRGLDDGAGCPASGPGVPGSAAAPGWLGSGLLVKRRVVVRPPAG
jgi:hypothetical protein